MHRDFAKGILFVLGLGVSIPGAGCWSGDDDNEGRICASPIEGGKYCVDSSSGPGAAWNDAIANGSEPIEMWAVWPKKYELSYVVSSPVLLEAWFDDMRAILDYVRVTKGSAESYRATMEGRMGDDLDRAKRMQNELLFEKRFDWKEEVSKLLLQKAATEIDPLKAAVTADKQAFSEMQAVVDQAKVDGAPFAAHYKTFVDDFLAYRATETAETLL